MAYPCTCLARWWGRGGVGMSVQAVAPVQSGWVEGGACWGRMGSEKTRLFWGGGPNFEFRFLLRCSPALYESTEPKNTQIRSLWPQIWLYEGVRGKTRFSGARGLEMHGDAPPQWATKSSKTSPAQPSTPLEGLGVRASVEEAALGCWQGARRGSKMLHLLPHPHPHFNTVACTPYSNFHQLDHPINSA